MADTGRFTLGVFQDAEWARRGLEALLRDGFIPESLTIIARESEEASGLIESTLGTAPDTLEIKGLGRCAVRGPLLATLQGADRGLSSIGIAGTITRAGFQAHDGFIYETLTGRGGVLVAIRHEPRAADALAKLHAYGAGNAAIGAWTGRV